jgi:hypothetical protein
MSALVEIACVSTTAFECASMDDCIDAGIAGRCEASGFCSFPDASCPSEQRYGDHAGDGLGGECVPPDDGSTGIADTGSDTSPTTAAETATTSSAAETTPLSDSGESSGVSSLTALGSSDATTSVDATTGDPTDGSSDTGTTTTGGTEPTCPSFVDDFEDGAIDASWTLMDGLFVTETMGELVFELSPENEAVYPGVRRPDQDLANGEVRIRIGQPPNSDSERLYLAVAVDEAFSDVLYIMIEGTTLRMEREQAGLFTYYSDVPYDVLAHHWLQIRGADDAVHFEVSADGDNFETLFSTEAPFPLLDTTIVVAATNFSVLPMTAYVSVADFEICNGA